MIDSNDTYEALTSDAAQQIVLGAASALGITVATGSVEEQISAFFTQWLLAVDNTIGQSYALQIRPQGAFIDLQNPNVPRLAAKSATGYLQLTNSTASPILVSVNSIFTAANGNVYSTLINTVVVAANGQNVISVTSQVAKASQNLPANQTFTNSLNLTATNPQPFTNGIDAETDTTYLARIITRQTNLSSVHATQTAQLELEQYYPAARIFVNNTANAMITPIPVPPSGITPVIKTPSGPAASALESQNAFQILANRFQFNNIYSVATFWHKVLSDVVYSGQLPQQFYYVPAQAVTPTITATLNVHFATNTDPTEKNTQAVAFASFFAQNLVNYFSGASGSANIIFTPLVGAPVNTAAAVLASTTSFTDAIAPAFSIEQIRALVSDIIELPQTALLEYLSLASLQVLLDSGLAYENTYLLDAINPYGVKSIDFKSTALFSDGTSWFDRYIFIDPSKITITVVEQ